MKRIFYYNINYFCNNKCVFCFSSSTGEKDGIVTRMQIIEDIKAQKMGKDDLIVINGGEPTLHTDFYKIVQYIIEETDSHISIYTNGTILDASSIPDTDRIKIIIPIHGSEVIHNRITQNKNSYKETIKSLLSLQEKKCITGLKFIVSKALIESNFKIIDFMENEGITPDEIIIARQNVTKKSIANRFDEMGIDDYGKYVSDAFYMLKSNYKLVFLDTPMCMLPGLNNEKMGCEVPPEFFFSDCNNRLENRKYYKQIMILPQCKGCVNINKCTMISRSYLTTVFDKEWCFRCE